MAILDIYGDCSNLLCISYHVHRESTDSLIILFTTCIPLIFYMLHCNIILNVGSNPSIEVSVTDITYEELTKGCRVDLRVSVSNSVQYIHRST